MNINPFDILKNAQKIQEQLGSIQEKLAEISATGSAGGGMVEVDFNGKLEILDVRIAAEIVAPENRRMIEELAAAAFNNGMEKIRETINRELGGLAGMAGVPGLSGMPGMPQ